MRRSQFVIPLILVGAFFLTVALAQEAQQSNAPKSGADAGALDPVKLAPERYKVTLDNDRVRVLDVTLRVNEKSPMHSHPAYVIYALSDGKARFTLPNGTSQEREFKAGETHFSEAETHAVENTGGTDLHVLNIELKQSGSMAGTAAQEQAETAAAHAGGHIFVSPEQMKWGDAPPGLPAGSQMAVLEGDPQKAGPFTIRFKVPAGFTIPPHWHSHDEHITVISGSTNMGHGDTLNKERATKLSAGSYAVMPAKMHHFAYFDEETVGQLHGTGPWDINYINPADDPRKSASSAQK